VLQKLRQGALAAALLLGAACADRVPAEPGAAEPDAARPPRAQGTQAQGTQAAASLSAPTPSGLLGELVGKRFGAEPTRESLDALRAQLASSGVPEAERARVEADVRARAQEQVMVFSPGSLSVRDREGTSTQRFQVVKSSADSLELRMLEAPPGHDVQRFVRQADGRVRVDGGAAGSAWLVPR
jgi:hypothetical protein